MNTLQTDKEIREEFEKWWETEQSPMHMDVNRKEVADFWLSKRAQDRTTLLEGLLKEVYGRIDLPILQGSIVAAYINGYNKAIEEVGKVILLKISHLGGDNEIQK